MKISLRWLDFPGNSSSIPEGDEKMRGRRVLEQIDTTCALNFLLTRNLQWTRADSAAEQHVEDKCPSFSMFNQRDGVFQNSKNHQ